MNPDAWIALAALTITVLATIVAAVVWLVRLEGRATANALAIVQSNQQLAHIADQLSAHIKAQSDALAMHANLSNDMGKELVRVQEQLKSLRESVERWLIPAPPPRSRQQKLEDGR